mgnify:CR=1 FL=1
MEGEALSDEELYRQVVDLIDTEVGLEPGNFEITVNGGVLAIYGDVPSEQANETLERLVYDSLDFEDVEYEVVVDEDLQAREGSLPDADPDSFGSFNAGTGNLGSQSPRRQF